jgi:hypothetical protein
LRFDLSKSLFLTALGVRHPKFIEKALALILSFTGQGISGSTCHGVLAVPDCRVQIVATPRVVDKSVELLLCLRSHNSCTKWPLVHSRGRNFDWFQRV